MKNTQPTEGGLNPLKSEASDTPTSAAELQNTSCAVAGRIRSRADAQQEHSASGAKTPPHVRG